MRIFIAGIDGYLGWALAQHLTDRGHQVAGADNFLRRQWVEEMGSWSATPILPMADRLKAFRERYGCEIPFWQGDLREYRLVEEIFKEEHYHRVDHQHLIDLGYKPTFNMDQELEAILQDLLPHAERIRAKQDVLVPSVGWQGERRKRSFLSAVGTH